MSLLLEALKKAEKAKEEAQRRGQDDAPGGAAPAAQPAAQEARAPSRSWRRRSKGRRTPHWTSSKRSRVGRQEQNRGLRRPRHRAQGVRGQVPGAESEAAVLHHPWRTWRVCDRHGDLLLDAAAAAFPAREPEPAAARRRSPGCNHPGPGPTGSAPVPQQQPQGAIPGLPTASAAPAVAAPPAKPAAPVAVERPPERERPVLRPLPTACDALGNGNRQDALRTPGASKGRLGIQSICRWRPRDGAH